MFTSYPPVLTKRDGAARFRAGEFGNASPSWDTVEKFTASGYTGLVHVRNGLVAGGATYYNTRPEDVVKVWQPGYYISAMVPPDVEASLVFQGEVQQAPPGCGRCGLDLFYTRIAKPMRTALAENAVQVSGIIARVTLECLMDPLSYDWLQVLLERYEGHVVEFSTYGRQWGTLPGYRTVFWEIRNY